MRSRSVVAAALAAVVVPGAASADVEFVRQATGFAWGQSAVYDVAAIGQSRWIAGYQRWQRVVVAGMPVTLVKPRPLLQRQTAAGWTSYGVGGVAEGTVTQIVAGSERNAWLTGQEHTAAGPVVPYTARWTGGVWEKVTGTPYSAGAFLAADDERLWVVESGTYKLFERSDGGWTPGPGAWSVTTLKGDPTTGIWLAGTDGDAPLLARRSGDGWQRVTPPDPASPVQSVLPLEGGQVIVRTDAGGLWLWTSGAWSSLNRGVLTPRDAARDAHGTLWVTDGSFGAFRWTGTTWLYQDVLPALGTDFAVRTVGWSPSGLWFGGETRSSHELVVARSS